MPCVLPDRAGLLQAPCLELQRFVLARPDPRGIHFGHDVPQVDGAPAHFLPPLHERLLFGAGRGEKRVGLRDRHVEIRRRVLQLSFYDFLARAFLNDGMLTLRRSTVSGNAALYGGGILNLGSLTVENCTFSANAATGTSSSGGGGAIDQYGSTASTTDSAMASSHSVKAS